MITAISEAIDLFGHAAGAAQGSLFADEGAPPPRDHAPDPQTIRRRLAVALASARAAPTQPWPEREARYWRTVFPQMADWLPSEEADGMRAAFAREVERLARRV